MPNVEWKSLRNDGCPRWCGWEFPGHANDPKPSPTDSPCVLRHVDGAWRAYCGSHFAPAAPPEQSRRDLTPADVHCPYCRAKPGHPCSEPNTTMTERDVHRDRSWAATGGKDGVFASAPPEQPKGEGIRLSDGSTLNLSIDSDRPVIEPPAQAATEVTHEQEDDDADR